jgi:methionyl-tRNA formyltransferase
LLLKIWEAAPVEQTGRVPGEILKVDRDALVVACGEDALRILSVQREGGRRLGLRDFLAGHALQPGQRFTSSSVVPG